MKTLFLTLILLLSSACAVIPEGGRLGWSHISHPFAGPPFGPTNEEDSLDTIEMTGAWYGPKNTYVEIGLGYKLSDGGFYGPKLTGIVRAGIEFKR